MVPPITNRSRWCRANETLDVGWRMVSADRPLKTIAATRSRRTYASCNRFRITVLAVAMRLFASIEADPSMTKTTADLVFTDLLTQIIGPQLERLAELPPSFNPVRGSGPQAGVDRNVGHSLLRSCRDVVTTPVDRLAEPALSALASRTGCLRQLNASRRGLDVEGAAGDLCIVGLKSTIS